MPDKYTYLQDLRAHTRVPENGILSQTLQNDDRSKIVLFGFTAGQELSAHTAPFPATLTVLKGEAALRLGEDVARITLDEVAEWSALYAKELVEP